MRISKDSIETVKEIMTRENLTISVAESVSSGYLQTMLGSISGAASFFEGGVTAYSLDQKVNLLRVDKKHALEVNCVSKCVAREMAQGACKLFKTNIGIATTGYAEPAPEFGIDQPISYICLYTEINKVSNFEFECEVDGDGLDWVPMQEDVAKIAFKALEEYLEKL